MTCKTGGLMNRRWVPRALELPVLVFTFTAVAYLQARPDQAPAPAAQAGQSAEQHALLNRYCAGCHNEKTKQGEFVLTTLDVGNVGSDTERWELVVRRSEERRGGKE